MATDRVVPVPIFLHRGTYAHAVRGLVRLEADPEGRLKYLDLIDICPKLLADLDPERLTISPGTFVTEALRKVYSDLIYRIPLPDSLLRHPAVRLSALRAQEPDRPLVLLQLLRYIVASGELYRDQHPKAKTLPPALIIVRSTSRDASSVDQARS
ncbi:Rpn family recombination-promoting nuclease/putative transposase [Thiorhodococcus minor]|uniref:Rpn family recombination-promoting nuclease/putative transposase n=1 Tax=Thiorhodococcus minor TaxID=57489 RepID=A0A6M0K4G9_9GAMM|nr:Rpn family recombination-promoting nuclease/putative transposase [Thiorhodococcus minor]NEV63255.1 Rpn family recombination-promoting nuclease/putative transposase [Thiorhodococcus minor]